MADVGNRAARDRGCVNGVKALRLEIPVIGIVPPRIRACSDLLVSSGSQRNEITARILLQTQEGQAGEWCCVRYGVVPQTQLARPCHIVSTDEFRNSPPS